MNIAWHSRGQRFDPAYLHQLERVKKDLKLRFQVFFYFPKCENGEFPVLPVLPEKWNESGIVFFLREQASQLCPVWNDDSTFCGPKRPYVFWVGPAAYAAGLLQGKRIAGLRNSGRSRNILWVKQPASDMYPAR